MVCFRRFGPRALDIASYHGEQIVEVVSYSAGELPERFHLLRLQELPLKPLAFAKITDDCDQ